MNKIENTMGYLPDEDVIRNAIAQHKNTPTEKLRQDLRDTMEYFRRIKGVDLAEEIDALTIALVLRNE